MKKLELKQMMSIIWRKKIAILVIVLMFGIIGTLYSYKYVNPMYKSTSTIILRDTGANDETYSLLIRNRTLIEEIKTKLKLNIQSTDLMKDINLKRINNSDLLQVTVVNENANVAQSILIEAIRIFLEDIKEIYNVNNAYIIENANIPEVPYNINHVRDIIVFFIIGFAVSMVCIFIYEPISKKIKSTKCFEKVSSKIINLNKTVKQKNNVKDSKEKQDEVIIKEKSPKEVKTDDKSEQQRKSKEEARKAKEIERKKKAEGNKERINKRREEFSKKVNLFKEKINAKKNEVLAKIKAKKEQFLQKYQEYKTKKQEENKIKKEQKDIRKAEKAKIQEEQRILKEAEKMKKAEENAIKQAELAKEREIKQAQIAEEKAKKEAENLKIREEERARKEAERLKREEQRALEQTKIAEEKAIRQAKVEEERAMKKAKLEEEKAKKEAELAEEKAKKEAENLRMREEKERKAKEKEEAKYTDEYLDENLYPKTKYNKF